MERIKIGWGRRETSIEGPVTLPGQMYERISTCIHDPTYATALCVDGGEGQDAVIFCSCDMVSLTCGGIDLTLEKLQQRRPDIPWQNVIMNATHTHAGPGIRGESDKSVDGMDIISGAKYREIFTDRCVEAIAEAWDNRAEGGMAYGYGYAVVGHSRRVIYTEDKGVVVPNAVAPNGHGVMYGNTNDPAFSHYEAGADHFLNAMFTFDRDNKLTGIVINVPCPSQLSEHFTMISADYWTEVRENVQKEFGEGVYVLPQCAAAGDLSPRTLHYKEAQVRRMTLKYGLSYDLSKIKEHKEDDYRKVMGERRDIAERILVGVKEIYGWASKDIQTVIPVRHLGKELQLARRMVTDEEKVWCEENIEKMRQQIPDKEHGTAEEIRIALSRYNSIKNRNEKAIARYEHQKEHPTEGCMVHAAQIGEIAFSSCQFELYMDFMHRIQARSPFIQTFVIQLAGNEGGSYLSTYRGTMNKGYSASLFCNQISYEGGQQLVEGTLEMLHALRERDSDPGNQ